MSKGHFKYGVLYRSDRSFANVQRLQPMVDIRGANIRCEKGASRNRNKLEKQKLKLPKGSGARGKS